jgi:hypothetical protein
LASHGLVPFLSAKDAADKEKLIEGANKLKQVAATVYARQDDGSHQLAIVTMT